VATPKAIVAPASQSSLRTAVAKPVAPTFSNVEPASRSN